MFKPGFYFNRNDLYPGSSPVLSTSEQTIPEPDEQSAIAIAPAPGEGGITVKNQVITGSDLVRFGLVFVVIIILLGFLGVTK